MATFEETVSAARESWNSNFTVADRRWRLSQLHRLHELVVENRDAIVSALATSEVRRPKLNNLQSDTREQNNPFRPYYTRESYQF